MLAVDLDFDTTILDGVIFEELFNSVVIYKRNGKYRGNHTRVGSMNELFGVPRYTRRLYATHSCDYTSAAWGIEKQSEPTPLTAVDKVVGWFGRVIAPYFY
jgi:hypothetical protein